MLTGYSVCIYRNFVEQTDIICIFQLGNSWIIERWANDSFTCCVVLYKY